MATSSQWLPPHKATFLPHQNNSTMLKALFIFIGVLLNLPHLNILFFFQCAFQKLAEEPYKTRLVRLVTKTPQNCKMHSKSNSRQKSKFILIYLFSYVAEYVIFLPYILFPPPLSRRERN